MTLDGPPMLTCLNQPRRVTFTFFVEYLINSYEPSKLSSKLLPWLKGPCQNKSAIVYNLLLNLAIRVLVINMY